MPWGNNTGSYFSPEFMLGIVGEYYDNAIKAGYKGARGAGEMSWALAEGRSTVPDLLNYEAMLVAEQYQGSIHLLVTDVVMPQMNGRDLWKKIAAVRPEIRTLYMSGYTSNVIAHHGVLEEGFHFLQKPFSIHTLAAKVRDVLDESPGA
ncbi:MAG: response regulator [Pseudomonadota bacterium]